MRPRSLLIVVLAVLAISSTFAQTRHTLFPQIAVGGGWSADFLITNQGFLPVSGLQLAFFGDNGAPLAVESDQGTNSVFSFNLAAGSTYALHVTLNSPTQTPGYADLSAPKFSSVIGTMTVRWETGGELLTQLGVIQQFPFEHFTFAARVAIDVPGQIRTNVGLALANGAPTLALTPAVAQDILITLINKDGSIRASKILHLGAGQHTSAFLGPGSGTTPLFDGLTDFEGTVSVSAPQPFGLLPLRIENEPATPASFALGTVAINEGPMLKSFLLDTAATPESEPNDNRTDADDLTLPVVVSGNISTPDDSDYFRFTANAGDILVAMVETETLLDSPLDSELYLLDANGNEITRNDQNGVYPQDDSAIRLVLPTTGTYYLMVWDYWGDIGDSTVNYKLHVKVVPAGQPF